MERTGDNEKRKPVAVFDSGVGGLPYLQRIREFLPEESYRYIADTAGFPYGEKSAEELRRIIHDRMGLVLRKLAPKIVVVACNTASVVALSELREAYGIPFVGVVPAIKPAAETTKNGKIGLLATKKTVDDSYTDWLESRFASDSRMYRFTGENIAALVEMVERRFFTIGQEEREAILRPAVDYFQKSGVDRLILACTHFVFLENELSALLGGGVVLVDSRDGVARQTKRLLEHEDLRRGDGSGEKAGAASSLASSFYVTKDTLTKDTDSSIYRQFAERFDLEWGGSIHQCADSI